MKLLPEATTLLVGSAHVVRSLARTISENGFNYSIERINFKNKNRYWKKQTGLALRVSLRAYKSLTN